MCAGRLFHAFGAATLKARSPNISHTNSPTGAKMAVVARPGLLYAMDLAVLAL